MESDYPPLSSQRIPDSPSHSGQARTSNGNNAPLNQHSDNLYRGIEVAPNGSKIRYQILSREGDAVLEYVDAGPRDIATQYRWQVSSNNLRRNSPFFSALLDPNKFAEGRLFQEKKFGVNQSSNICTDVDVPESEQQQSDEKIKENLPLISINLVPLTGKGRIQSLELFLKLLQFEGDDYQIAQLTEEIDRQPISVVAGILEVADLFSSSSIIHKILQRGNYKPSLKGKTSLSIFSPSLLDLSEDRIRQIIYISLLLENSTVFQVASHALILLGSTSWIGGPRNGKRGSHQWARFPNGIEEELYDRRQSVLNTITDLQAYFLRVYGALEDEPKQSQPFKNNIPPAGVISNVRPIQCRWGFGNSRACDSYHLGEMVRFFSIRSKTIFLGSTLIDPYHDEDDEEEDEDEEDEREDDEPEYIQSKASSTKNNATAGIASTNILSITASLRQVPDYQIDENHIGCGIRRRLLPALDRIDSFLGHRQALLGLKDPKLWKSGIASNKHKQNPDSWRNCSLGKVVAVNIDATKITAVERPIQKRSRRISTATTNAKPSSELARQGVVAMSMVPPPRPFIILRTYLETEARRLFTAEERKWESGRR
ncbi:hypothetical protein BGW36DRAFT_396661 [Talaromyces proteolyticus]|uniref:Uncharacterized protein n=1 Tax=Talaromyces proteolyticus TaxID=1131652 RepID=A0AAD4KTN6_9EURO|nr:uncharacterized protein BGW36DRAFT_396661 [Talaromyces proteolyticus]KAH8699061.1 hypothetical protein BGW36DRAFT_396661 [Talaromyces proteolyticus]